ncbi:hypothetical protein RB195_023159 [Necator americanus]|uniref:Uncharacterized protein n=1 Tax=Necator americanus TaxID=51031 RepID=A0ABR1EI32_NECAM
MITTRWAQKLKAKTQMATQQRIEASERCEQFFLWRMFNDPEQVGLKLMANRRSAQPVVSALSFYFQEIVAHLERYNNVMDTHGDYIDGCSPKRH